MMRFIIVITIFLSLLAQTFSKGIVFMQFFVHQDYIAKNLCENKEKPELKCNGHCHLNKALEKEHKKDSENLLNEKQEIVLFLTQIEFSVKLEKMEQVAAKYFHYNDPRGSNISFDIFHPPSIC